MQTRDMWEFLLAEAGLSSERLEALRELSELTDLRGWTPSRGEGAARGGLFIRGLLVGSRGLLAPEGVGGLGEYTERGVMGTCPAISEFADFVSVWNGGGVPMGGGMPIEGGVVRRGGMLSDGRAMGCLAANEATLLSNAVGVLVSPFFPLTSSRI